MTMMDGGWTSKNRNLMANHKDNANFSFMVAWVLVGR